MSAMTDRVKKRTVYLASQEQESHTSGYIQPKVNLVSSDLKTASGSSFLFQSSVPCLLTCPGFLSFVSAYTQNIQSHSSVKLGALESGPAFVIAK